MRYEITEFDDDVEIQVQQIGAHASRVLASLQDCQQGRCGCPTDQYDRLADMTVHTDADRLTIRLHPYDGQHFDTGQLQTCVDYTLEQARHDTQ